MIKYDMRNQFWGQILPQLNNPSGSQLWEQVQSQLGFYYFGQMRVLLWHLLIGWKDNE